MNNTLLQYKVKERLNKLDSKDFPNLDCFKITEAFNTFQLRWVREKIKEGEANKQVVEDLEPLIKPAELSGTNHEDYFETIALPKDWFSNSRVEVIASRDGCKASLKSELIEQGNAYIFLSEYTTSPSYDWRETFHTMNSGRIRVYRSDFSVESVKLIYYRFPRPISISGCENEMGEGVLDTPCEFKDDVAEILVSGTCAILAGDIENFNQVQRNTVT